jgi:hypothetical protein
MLFESDNIDYRNCFDRHMYLITYFRLQMFNDYVHVHKLKTLYKFRSFDNMIWLAGIEPTPASQVPTQRP